MCDGIYGSCGIWVVSKKADLTRLGSLNALDILMNKYCFSNKVFKCFSLYKFMSENFLSPICTLDLIYAVPPTISHNHCCWSSVSFSNFLYVCKQICAFTYFSDTLLSTHKIAICYLNLVFCT